MEGSPPQGAPRSSTNTLPRPADFLAALALLTNLPLSPPDSRGDAFGRIALLFPVVGAMLGGFLVALDLVVFPRVPALLASIVIIVVWELVARRPRSEDAERTGRFVRTVALSLAVVKALALWALPAPRVLGLFFAPLLGRWSMVVLAVGARDAGTPGRKFAPAVLFNEFALASLFTFAVVFAISEAVGVLLVVGAAAVTLLLRLLSHAQAGGISWSWVAIGSQVIEATTLLLLVAIAA